MINHKNDAGNIIKQQRFMLPVSQDKFLEFARGITGGEILARKHWVETTKKLTRSEYDGLMRILIEADLLVDNGPKKARILSDEGKAALSEKIKEIESD